MKYIVDASVAIKWVLNEPGAERALSLRDEFENWATDLIAPDIFPVELAHVLSKGFRQGKLTADEADAYFADLMSGLPSLISSRSLLSRAFRISQQTRTGVYDALYLALGELEKAPVITADARMAKLPFDILLIDDLPPSNANPNRLPK